MPPIEFAGCNPIVPVSDLPTSVEYYVEKLGFSIDWGTPGVITAVSRGRCGLFLVEADQGHSGTWVYIGVGDAAALHDEFTRKGALIRQPPTNFAWALEMQVSDPDGNVLRFGSEPIPGAPEGPWLDMHGRRWAQSADGWRREDDAR